MKILKGKLYTWTIGAPLTVLALTGEYMDTDPDSNTYREYVFKGRVVQDVSSVLDTGSVDVFIAECWEDGWL